MSTHVRIVPGRNRRRALVAVQVGVMLLVLLGMAALTIDVGTLYNARGDLQRTSDAAALAGASVYTTDAMMRIRMGTGGTTNWSCPDRTQHTQSRKYATAVSWTFA